MTIVTNLKKDWYVYTICLLSVLICMVYYYNIEKYQQANTNAWEAFVDKCNCQCLVSTHPPAFPNITKQFNIPIIKEIKESANNEEGNNNKDK